MRFSVAFCTACKDISGKCLREVSGSASSRKKLKSNCATRWVERHDSIIIYVTPLPAVVSALEELQQENKQVEVASKAGTLLNSVQKCTFLIAALVIQHTFGIILPVLKLPANKRIGYICRE